MELPRSLVLVNYAVNGRGLGHVCRLAAINRWLRRYATFAGVTTQHWFLTTSEADTLLFHEGFASFKLPSKSIVEEAGIPKASYLALAKQWVWSAVALLRPDLLVVDTFPNGSFDELLGVLDLCRHKALVARRVRQELADRPAYRALVTLYDRVIVPGADGDPAEPPAEVRRDQIRAVGPVMLTERFEALSRGAARARIGVPEDAFCLLVSGGGGGDQTVAALLDAVVAAVAHDPTIHLLLAAGPLYRGEPRRGPRITFWTETRLAEVLPGVDGAISAAGFNATHELLHFGVPTAFFAQTKIADDQYGRVAAMVGAGAALDLRAVEPSTLAATVAALRDPSTAAGLREAGLRRVPRNHARDAAAELLELVLPTSVVRQAAAIVDDQLLAEAQALGVELGHLVDAAVGLLGNPRTVDRAALDLQPARTLLRAAREVGMPQKLAVRLATLLGRKLCAPQVGPDEIGEAAAALLAHPAAHGQWSALVSLVERLRTEREVAPARAAEQIVTVMDVSAAVGLDLFRVVQEVTRLQAEPDGEQPNRLLLERARVRLQSVGGPS